MDRGELGRFLFAAENYDRAHAALAVPRSAPTGRAAPACATNVENLAFERGHRTLRIVGKGNKPAVIPLVPRTARTDDLAIGERHEGPILVRRDGQRLDRRTAHRWVRSIGRRDSATSIPTCCAPRSSWPPSTPASHCATFNSPPATPHTSSSPSSPAAENVTSRHFGDAATWVILSVPLGRSAVISLPVPK